MMPFQDAHAGLPMPERFHAIVALSFGTGLVVIDNNIATVALPTIAQSLHITPSASVLVVTVYQMILLMAVLPFSALGDRIGLKRLYQGGQALFLVATIAAALADSLTTLLIARSCQALGVAGALSVGAALLRRVYPSAQLARGLGLNGIIIASAAALAPTLGGYLLTLGSWRWVFAAAAPFALLSLVLGQKLPAQPATRDRYDRLGALLSAGTFGLLIGGLQAIAQGATASVAVLLLLAGVAVGALFVRRELHQAAPILPVDLLARAELTLPVLAALAAFTGTSMFTLSLPFMLQSGHGMSPTEIGSILAAWPLTMMATAPIAGVLAGRVPSGLLGCAGMTCTALGLALMATVAPDATTVRLVIPLILGGAGFGLFLAPNSHQIMSAAPHGRSASAGALTTTTRLVASAIGTTLLAGFLSLELRNSPTPALVAAGLVTLAAIFSLCNLKRQTRAHIDARALEESSGGTIL
jgi:MFS transporter, DHA2 family, multidrug resistance protein